MAQLWAPEEYWRLTHEEKRHFRCGPSRGLLEIIVPDVWRIGWPFVRPLVVTPACSIHDFMYQFGAPFEEYRNHADRAFRNNLLRLVFEAGGPGIIIRARQRKCEIYYQAVKCFGGPAFWNGKNPPSEVHTMNWDENE